MIALRRNDKIIILVGVVILLAAGAALAVFQVPSPQMPINQQTNTGSVAVTWTVKNASLPSLSDYAPKGVPYSMELQINQTNLRTVMFNLRWVDDRTSLLRLRGLDTLSLLITGPDGSQYAAQAKSARFSRSGNFTIEVPVGAVPPSIRTIEASSVQEARRILAQRFSNDTWAGKDINITVTVDIGERFPMRFRDRGNDFTIDISYSYYDPKLNQTTTQTGLDEDLPPIDWDDPQQQTPPYMSMIIQTGRGRFV